MAEGYLHTCTDEQMGIYTGQRACRPADSPLEAPMSFSLAAVGNAAEVKQQLAHADLSSGGELAGSVRDVVAKSIAGVQEYPEPDYETRFVVEANGHADSHTSNITVSVRTIFVRVRNQDDGEVSEAD